MVNVTVLKYYEIKPQEQCFGLHVLMLKCTVAGG